MQYLVLSNVDSLAHCVICLSKHIDNCIESSFWMSKHHRVVSTLQFNHECWCSPSCLMKLAKVEWASFHSVGQLCTRWKLSSGNAEPSCWEYPEKCCSWNTYLHHFSSNIEGLRDLPIAQSRDLHIVMEYMYDDDWLLGTPILFEDLLFCISVNGV